MKANILDKIDLEKLNCVSSMVFDTHAIIHIHYRDSNELEVFNYNNPEDLKKYFYDLETLNNYMKENVCHF